MSGHSAFKQERGLPDSLEDEGMFRDEIVHKMKYQLGQISFSL